MPLHEHFMQLALEQAQVGESLGEIPVGAVLVLDGKVIAVGHNQTVSKCDPTAHAEIVAIRAAARTLGNYRLTQCTLYVTLEPCAMCMGAVLHSRIARLYYGTKDPKTGACGSVLDIPGDPQINHHCEVHGGILQMQCAQHLMAYFQQLRDEKRRMARAPLREDAVRMDTRVLAPLIPHAESVQLDNLLASHGLRVQAWRSPHSTHNPDCLVLCLHGATSWSYIYHSLFSERIPANTVIWAVDLPGHGGSDKTKKGGELADCTLQLRILTELLALVGAQRIHILAQDTGCELGLRLAADIPDRISGFTLLNPACSDFKPVDRPGTPIRSWQQFRTYLDTQSEGDFDVAKALFAPYPDAGHAAGMLKRLNSKPPDTPMLAIPVQEECTKNSEVHVGHAHAGEFLQFKAKFGLTFKVIEHACVSAFVGLKATSIWKSVLHRVSIHGQ